MLLHPKFAKEQLDSGQLDIISYNEWKMNELKTATLTKHPRRAEAVQKIQPWTSHSYLKSRFEIAVAKESWTSH